MPQVATDLREYRRNRAPGDWAPWILSDTLANIARAPTDTVDRNYMECYLADGKLAGSLAGYSFEPAGDVGDCEVLVKFVQGAEARTEDKLLALRAGGSAGSEDLALLTVFQVGAQTQIHLTTYSAGVETAVTSFILGSFLPVLRPMNIRFRITGTRTAGDAKAWVRAWLEGDAEPTTWQIEDEGPLDIEDTGRVVWMAGDVVADHRLLAFTLGTDGDPGPDFPGSPDLTLEAAAPWYIAQAAVYDRDTEAEVELWIPQSDLPSPGWATAGGIQTGPLDYPADETFEAVGPVLSTDFLIDQALELDGFAALIPQQLRDLKLVDEPNPGDPNAPPSRPVRTVAQSYRWTGGRVTLYAVPRGAASLRERVALATGIPAEEPTADGDEITIPLDSPLKLIGEKNVEVERYVGAPSGWQRLNGNQEVSVPHIAAYNITAFTLLTRFKSSSFATTGSPIFWQRTDGGNGIWTRIQALGDSSGRIRWTIGDGATTSNIVTTDSSAPLDDGEPHTLIAAIDGDRRFYLAIDGEIVAEGTPPFAVATPAAATLVARNNDGGYITDQRIVNGFLEVEQAVALQATAQQTDDLDLSTLGYWRFDDGAGTTITDYAPSANHATASGVEDTDFEWVPTDLGMAELAGRAMPWAHGAFWNAPVDAHDHQRDRYRVTDREITEPAIPTITLRARGVDILHGDAGGGVLTTATTLDEPVTWAQLKAVLYEDMLREMLPIRAALALGDDLSDESLAMLGRLLPDTAGYAAPQGSIPKVTALLEELIGQPGGHLRMAADGLAIAGYLLPPVSPGPDGESPVLEYAGLSRAIHVPPPDSTTYQDYTVCAWVKDFAGFGSPSNAAEVGSTDLLPCSTYACHYDPADPDEILYLLGSDGRVRSGLVFGDSTSTAPFYVTAPGSLPIGEWVFVAGVADASSTATRYLYRMLVGGLGVEKVASGAYSGVVVGDRPGDGYTALGARPDGTAAMVGSIAHFAFWGRALTEAELDTVATGTPLDVATGLVSYVPGTEGDGDFIEDVVADQSAIIQGQRWAPRLRVDLHALQGRAELGAELVQRPAKEILARYRPNHRPITGADLAGSLSVAERRSFIEEHREAAWREGPSDGQEVVIHTPFLHAIAAQRIIELQRQRRAEGRYTRDLTLSRSAYTLNLGEEVRLDNLPAGGSWTGRVVALSRRAHEIKAGLWG